MGDRERHRVWPGRRVPHSVAAPTTSRVGQCSNERATTNQPAAIDGRETNQPLLVDEDKGSVWETEQDTASALADRYPTAWPRPRRAGSDNARTNERRRINRPPLMAGKPTSRCWWTKTRARYGRPSKEKCRYGRPNKKESPGTLSAQAL